MTMKKRATGLLLTGALGLGGMVTGVVVAPAVASAATSDTTAADALSDRVSRITEALAGLVGAGTITQEQADAVASTLAEQMPERGHGHSGGRGFGLGLDTAADVLGISADELRTELQSGRSLADVAAEQGVDRQFLIDRLVAAATERLDEKVASGDLTQAEADARKAELTERITAAVDREGLPARGGHRRGGGPGPGQGAETGPNAGS